MAPAATAADIVTKLSATVAQAAKSPEVISGCARRDRACRAAAHVNLGSFVREQPSA